MILPTPDQDALNHSAKITAHIRDEIEKNRGSITFARFMELALYAPGLGYYSAGMRKFGSGGDFVTAPEISPLFAKCVANQCRQILQAWMPAFANMTPHGVSCTTDSKDSAMTSASAATNRAPASILEIGAGSGVFARDLLRQLEDYNCLPQKYYILEVSADLRERQRTFLKTHHADLFTEIIWLDKLPENFKGIIFANEVMDAMPVHCFRIQIDGIKERCVTWENNQFVEVYKDAPAELAQRVEALRATYKLPLGYESEINLTLSGWIAALADCLQEGVILLSDYGYGRSEYYHPDRHQGTLKCFYRHHHHTNPFQHVGLQDMTAHVDFTSVIESAATHQMQLGGYTTQASFLLANGLLDFAASSTPATIPQYEQNQAIKMLTLPSQMGELIKFMSLTKNFSHPLLGFSLHDRSRDL